MTRSLHEKRLSICRQISTWERPSSHVPSSAGFHCELRVLQGLLYGTSLASAKQKDLLLFLQELSELWEGRVSQASSCQEGWHSWSTNEQDLKDRKVPPYPDEDIVERTEIKNAKPGKRKGATSVFVLFQTALLPLQIPMFLFPLAVSLRRSNLGSF